MKNLTVILHGIADFAQQTELFSDVGKYAARYVVMSNPQLDETVRRPVATYAARAIWSGGRWLSKTPGLGSALAAIACWKRR